MNCCDHGLIVLPMFPIVPTDLADVIYTPHVKTNIRAYNTAMCMASIGHESKGLNFGAFVLGGRTYHRMGKLQPDTGQQHSFAQIYMLDVDAATDRRLGVFGGELGGLKRTVLAALHTLLLAHNPWIRQFVAVARDNVPTLVWKCENDISSMSIGALVSAPGSRRDIVLQRTSGSLCFIHDGHALYHPLAYPLLFPMGTAGWQEDMMVTNAEATSDRRLSLTDWGRYYLMHRGASLTHWQRCGNLSLEFYCDMWAQVEARSCSFHRLPQQQLKYRGARVAAVEDQLQAGVSAGDIGQPVIRCFFYLFLLS